MSSSAPTAALGTDSKTEHAPWSLEQRLRRQLVCALVLIWLPAAAATLVLHQLAMTRVLDSALEETAQRVLTLPAPAGTAVMPYHREILQLQLFDDQAQLLWRSHEAPTVPLAPLTQPGTRTQEGQRVTVQSTLDGSRIAVAAEDLSDRRAALWDTARWLVIAMLLLLWASTLIVRLLLRRGFGRVEPLRRSLATLASAGQLQLAADSPVGEGLPSELVPLARTIHALLGRVRQLLRAEQLFATQSAHELRTPLATAKAQAQRLIDELPAGPAHDRALALHGKLDQLARLCTKLLQFSRVDAGVAFAHEPMSLRLLAMLVVDEFHVEPDRLRMLAGETDVIVHGDIDAIGFALRNLIDNALRHGGAQAQVTVTVHDDARITVEDDGPGVPPGLLSKVMQPFERLTKQADGSGLGLPIASKVAQQSGGSLLLESPVRGGRGFRATLALPTA
jgi:two-component system, OmpR family, sensor kinase